MKLFIDANPGLFRRIQKQYTFADYSVEELAQIFSVQLRRNGFTFEGYDSGPQVERGVGEIIGRNTVEKQRSRMNAGLVDQLMQMAKEVLDSRLDLDSDDLEDKICNFTHSDLERAVARLKQNWERYEKLAAEVEMAAALLDDDDIVPPGSPPPLFLLPPDSNIRDLSPESTILTHRSGACAATPRPLAQLSSPSVFSQYGYNNPLLVRTLAAKYDNDMERVLEDLS